MKRVLSFLILGFLPFFFFSSFSFSMSEDWIPPTTTNEQHWRYNQFNIHPLAQQVCDQLVSDLNTSSTSVYTFSGISILSSSQSTCDIRQTLPDTSFFDHNFFIGLVSVTLIQCNDPNYQNGLDTDGLDGVDQCHPTQCLDIGLFWSNGNGVSTGSGSICVQNPITGIDCRYDAIQNSDGSQSNFTFAQTGQGCDCSNEFIPCNPLSDGEVTDYPQGQDGCVAMGESIFCSANPDDHCRNGVCDPGCGYIGADFVCVENTLPPEDTLACVDGDSRPSCQGIMPGDCPNGVLNCGNNPDTPPAAPCVANDPRPECNGVPEGASPDSPEGLATSGDLSSIGGILEQGNRNTNDIKNNTKKIADALTEPVDDNTNLDPDNNTDWSDTVSRVDQFTSIGDVNSSESEFKTNFEGQEGFFNTQILGVLPTGGTCQNLTSTFPRATVVIDFCSYAIHAKIVIEWAMILAFLIYIRSAFIRLRPN